jgi:hypothetical protein
MADRPKPMAANDAHRKRQQAQHPDVTTTGMYNVLEKLRSGEAPTRRPTVEAATPSPRVSSRPAESAPSADRAAPPSARRPCARAAFPSRTASPRSRAQTWARDRTRGRRSPRTSHSLRRGRPRGTTRQRHRPATGDPEASGRWSSPASGAHRAPRRSGRTPPRPDGGSLVRWFTGPLPSSPPRRRGRAPRCS